MKIQAFQFNMFGVNTYLVWDETSREAAIIDPGMMSSKDNDEIARFISANSLSLKYLLNTHLHIDHTLGNDFIENEYKVVTSANDADTFLGQRRREQAQMFGLPISDISPLTGTHNLKDNDRLYLGEQYIQVIAVPGHSPGSVAFYCPESQFVVTGDALFQGSIGRTDLPGGNHRQLIDSITTRLLKLPDNTQVYPGHGPKTTIGYERMANPYL